MKIDSICPIGRMVVRKMKRRVKVAIVDSGVDMKDEYITQSCEEGMSITINDNIVEIKKNFNDQNGHGTYVANLIRMLNKDVSFSIVKILNKDNKCTMRSLISALEYLKNSNVHIINLSLSTQKKEGVSELKRVCEQLRRQNKVIVSSAINNMKRGYPAMFPDVIGVLGDVRICKQKFGFNKSFNLQCVANSVPILVKDLTGEYTFFGGISKASAEFTATISQIVSQYSEVDMLESDLEKCALNREWNINNLETDLKKVGKQTWGKNNLNSHEREDILDMVCEELGISNGGRETFQNRTLFAPEFKMNKESGGRIIKRLEKRFTLCLSHQYIPITILQSIDTIEGFVSEILSREEK